MKEEDEGCQFEEFQYVASQVWEEKIGKGTDQFPRKMVPPAPRGKEWSEEGDDLKLRSPKLCKKFGYE